MQNVRIQEEYKIQYNSEFTWKGTPSVISCRDHIYPEKRPSYKLKQNNQVNVAEENSAE